MARRARKTVWPLHLQQCVALGQMTEARGEIKRSVFVSDPSPPGGRTEQRELSVFTRQRELISLTSDLVSSLTCNACCHGYYQISLIVNPRPLNTGQAVSDPSWLSRKQVV